MPKSEYVFINSSYLQIMIWELIIKMIFKFIYFVIIQFVLRINNGFILTVACMSFFDVTNASAGAALPASELLPLCGDLSYVLAVHA